MLFQVFSINYSFIQFSYLFAHWHCVLTGWDILFDSIYLSYLFEGEMKQNQWVEQVERAIRNVHEADVKSVLEKIRGFANIPRKETKFINFLLNSIRIRDRNLCVKVSWAFSIYIFKCGIFC